MKRLVRYGVALLMLGYVSGSCRDIPFPPNELELSGTLTDTSGKPLPPTMVRFLTIKSEITFTTRRWYVFDSVRSDTDGRFVKRVNDKSTRCQDYGIQALSPAYQQILWDSTSMYRCIASTGKLSFDLKFVRVR